MCPRVLCYKFMKKGSVSKQSSSMTTYSRHLCGAPLLEREIRQSPLGERFKKLILPSAMSAGSVQFFAGKPEEHSEACPSAPAARVPSWIYAPRGSRNADKTAEPAYEAAFKGCFRRRYD